MAYGGALTSAISLTGGLGQRATGDGPSNKSIALDAFGAVPLLGRFGSAVRTATISGRLSGEETAAGEIIDVGHAGIHQFPGIKQGKSQFFDGENLGRLSDTNKVMGVLQKNGYVRYVLRAEHSVGVDRTSGLPTNLYTVIKKKDGSVVTLFPGTSMKG
jgi:hypothetical protein